MNIYYRKEIILDFPKAQPNDGGGKRSADDKNGNKKHMLSSQICRECK